MSRPTTYGHECRALLGKCPGISEYLESGHPVNYDFFVTRLLFHNFFLSAFSSCTMVTVCDEATLVKDGRQFFCIYIHSNR